MRIPIFLEFSHCISYQHALLHEYLFHIRNLPGEDRSGLRLAQGTKLGHMRCRRPLVTVTYVRRECIGTVIILETTLTNSFQVDRPRYVLLVGMAKQECLVSTRVTSTGCSYLVSAKAYLWTRCLFVSCEVIVVNLLLKPLDQMQCERCQKKAGWIKVSRQDLDFIKNESYKLHNSYVLAVPPAYCLHSQISSARVMCCGVGLAAVGEGCMHIWYAY